MGKQKLNMIVAGMLASMSFGVNASLVIYSNSIEKAAETKNVGNYEFNQRGLSSEQAPVISGFGKNMPLDLSLKIIIPSNWQTNLNKSAVKFPVSWKGNATWPYVLENLAQKNNLLINIDWRKRIVDVFSKDAEEQMIAKQKKATETFKIEQDALILKTKHAIEKAEQSRLLIVENIKREKIKDQKLMKAFAYTQKENAIVTNYNKTNTGRKLNIHSIFENSNVLSLDRTEAGFVNMITDKSLRAYDDAWYYIKEDRMLSENLIEWAQKANWTLLWKASYDFDIRKGIQYKGNLIENIDNIMSLYKNSKKPLMSGVFLKSKLIVIKDFNYKEIIAKGTRYDNK